MIQPNTTTPNYPAIATALGVGMPMHEGIHEKTRAQYLCLKARWQKANKPPDVRENGSIYFNEPVHIIAHDATAFATEALQAIRRVRQNLTFERERAMEKLRIKYRAVAERWAETFEAVACRDVGVVAIDNRIRHCKQAEAAWKHVIPPE